MKDPSPAGAQKNVVGDKIILSACPVLDTYSYPRNDQARTLEEMKDAFHAPLRSDEEARQQAAFCRGLFYNNTSGVARFDANLKLLEVNDPLVKLTRFTRKRLLKMHILQFVDLSDKKRVTAFFNAMRAGRTYDGSLEFVMRNRTGRALHVHAAPTAFYHDDGSFSQGIIVLTDITKRRIAEQKLRQQSEFQQTLLNKTSALLIVYDPSGRIQHISPAVEKLFGYANEDVRGANMWKLGAVPEEEIAKSRKRLQTLLNGAEHISSTMRLRTRSGEERTMEIISTAVRKVGGGVDCIIATGTDITERQKVQREVLGAAEAEQARIGHDLHDGIGQTLTGMLALTESLESRLAGPLKADAARITGVLREAIQNVRRLSHGMSPVAIRYRGLAEALLLLAETVRQNFRTRCICEIDPAAGDPDPDAQIHLFRIAQESVSNALRHGRAKKVTIALKRIAEGRCELSIKDNGGGIIKGRDNHDGMGLRLMEYRAGIIGGALKVKSRKGHGVAVSCRFDCLKKQKSPKTLTTPVKSSKNRPS